MLADGEKNPHIQGNGNVEYDLGKKRKNRESNSDNDTLEKDLTLLDDVGAERPAISQCPDELENSSSAICSAPSTSALSTLPCVGGEKDVCHRDEGHRKASQSTIPTTSPQSPATPSNGPLSTTFSQYPANASVHDRSNSCRASTGEPPSPPAPSWGIQTYPEGGLTAWLVVLGAFCGMFSAFGLLNTLGVLQAYLSTHQLAGYSPAAVGWIFSVYVFMAFFGGVQVGPIFDKRGPKQLITLGGIFLVGGTLGLANATEYWHFMLALSISGGLGTSLIFTPSISSIAHFFCVRRGYATGLAATGGSVGGVLYPLVLPVLFSRLGWTWTMRILALIFAAFVSVAVILLKARITPEDSEAEEESEVEAASPTLEESSSGPSLANARGTITVPPKKKSVWVDFRIFRSPQFAITTAGVFMIEWGLFVPITYISSWAIETGVDGIDPATTSSATLTNSFPFQLLAILNAGSFFGRWIPGVVADRIGRFNAMSGATLLALLTLLVLWLPSSLEDNSARGSIAMAVLFALGFGFASGSGISLSSVCVGELCAVEEYGRYYATCYTVVSFGCLTGVPLAGAVVTACGGEYWGLVLFTAACYVCGLACFLAVRVMRGGWSVKAVC